MKLIETTIEGVRIVEPAVFSDARGYFYESYNAQTFRAAGISDQFVQDNQSKSSYGVIRGLHCQLGAHAQAKLVRVIQGRILDVAVDIRINSPTYGQKVIVELSAENMRQLYIPRGFLHGFSVLEEGTVLSYKCDNFYSKEAESGVRFDDPQLDIDWGVPREKAIISDKDNALKGFKDVTGYGG